MNRLKTQRQDNVRVVITNIFMALSVVAITAILLLTSMGFYVNRHGQIQQTGLVEISSQPTRATVEIDDKVQLAHTKISTMLDPGKHQIKITKPGYDNWEYELDVASGVVTNLEWARLFPLQPETKTVLTFEDLRLVAFSENRQNLLVVEKDRDALEVINLQTAEPKAVTSKLSTALRTTPEKALQGDLTLIDWSGNGDKLLFRWENGKHNDFYLASLKTPEKNLNLSQEFNLPFEQIIFADDSASKLWVLTNHDLRSIDVTNRNISTILAKNVETIVNDQNVVAFVNTDADGSRAIRLYRDGESGSSVIKRLSPPKTTNDDKNDTKNNVNDDTKNDQPNDQSQTDQPGKSIPPEYADAKVSIVMNEHWGASWFVFTIGQKLFVFSGRYPSFDQPVAEEALLLQNTFELPFTPIVADTGGKNARLIAFSDGTSIASLDLETLKHYNFTAEAPLTTLNWLDSFLFWQKKDRSIFVRDFNGANRRELLTNHDNAFPILLTQNNDWLYYFQNTVKEYPAVDCAHPDTVSDPKTEGINLQQCTRVQFQLQRENLRI